MSSVGNIEDGDDGFFCDNKSITGTVFSTRTIDSKLGGAAASDFMVSWREDDELEVKSTFTLQSLQSLRMDLLSDSKSLSGRPGAATEEAKQAAAGPGGARAVEQATQPPTSVRLYLGDGGSEEEDEDDGRGIIDLSKAGEADNGNREEKSAAGLSLPDEKNLNLWTQDKSKFKRTLLKYLQHSAGQEGVLALAPVREKSGAPVSEQPGPTGQGSELQVPMCRLMRPDGDPQDWEEIRSDSSPQDQGESTKKKTKSARVTYMLCSFHLAEAPCFNVLRVPGLPLDAYNLGYEKLAGRYQATLQIELVPIAELLPIVVTRSSEICWGQQCGANRVYDVRYQKNLWRLLAERGRVGEPIIIDRNNSNCYNPTTNEPENPSSTPRDDSAFGNEGGYGRLSTWLHRQIELGHVATETREVLDEWLQAAHTVYSTGCERWLAANGDGRDRASDGGEHIWLAATKRSRKPHKPQYKRTDAGSEYRYRGALPFARASLFCFNTFYATSDHQPLASWLAEQPEPGPDDEAGGRKLTAELQEKLVDVMQLIVRLSQTLANFPHDFYSKEKNGLTGKRQEAELAWNERGCFVSTAVSVYNVLLVSDTEQEDELRLAFNKKDRDNRPWTNFNLPWAGDRKTGALLKVCKWHVGRLPPQAAKDQYQLMKTYNLLHQLEREQLHKDRKLTVYLSQVEKDKELVQPATLPAWKELALGCRFDDCQKIVADKFRQAAGKSVSRSQEQRARAKAAAEGLATSEHWNVNWLAEIQDEKAGVESEYNQALANLQPMQDLRAGETALRYRCLCASLPAGPAGSGDHGLPPPDLQEPESSPFVLAQLVLLASSLYTLGLPLSKQLLFEKALLAFVWERLRPRADSLYRLLAYLAEDEACRLFSERSPELRTTSPSCLSVLELHCQLLSAQPPPPPPSHTPAEANHVPHSDHPVRRLLRVLTAHPFFLGWAKQQQTQTAGASGRLSLGQAARQLYMRKLYPIDYAYHIKSNDTAFTPSAGHTPGMSLADNQLPILDAGWVKNIWQAIEQNSAAPILDPTKSDGKGDYVYLCPPDPADSSLGPRVPVLAPVRDCHTSVAWWNTLTTKLGRLPAGSRRSAMSKSDALQQQKWYIIPPQPIPTRDAQEHDDDDDRAGSRGGEEGYVPAARKRLTPTAPPGPPPGRRRRPPQSKPKKPRRQPAKATRKSSRSLPPPQPTPWTPRADPPSLPLTPQEPLTTTVVPRPKRRSASPPSSSECELESQALGAVISLGTYEINMAAVLNGLLSGPTARQKRGTKNLTPPNKKKRQAPSQPSLTPAADPVPDSGSFLQLYLEDDADL